MQIIPLNTYISKQDSPPVWTQEAYCPLRSEYSLCPILGGYPIPGWGSTLSWGIHHLGLGYPWEGTWDQSLGYPQKGWKDMGPVEVLWDGAGIPLPPWLWTGRHLWKQYLPIALCMRAVKIFQPATTTPQVKIMADRVGRQSSFSR